MAKYTTELRTLLKNNFDIGLADYPIFDEEYRPVLNKKIIDHYMFSEIGFETAALFKHYLNTKMNEIMPYYNKLYLSERIEFDPLRDFDESTDETRDRTGNTQVNAQAYDSVQTSGQTTGASSNTDSTSASTSGLDVASDTPQGMLNTTDIGANEYASSAQKSTGSSSGSSTGSSTTGTEYLDTKDGSGSSESITDSTVNDVIGRHHYGYGKGKAPSELLELYRKTFLNIDMMIINELNDLFMLVY